MATNKVVQQKMREEYIGKVFKSNAFGDCTVIEYIDTNNVVVKFADTGHETKVSAGNLRSGLVRDLLQPNVAGVGFMGVGKYFCRHKGRGGSRTDEYAYWESMMKRVYNPQTESYARPYRDCSVSEVWHNFQNFAEWCQGQEGFSKNGFQLDKDLLVKGNKVYGPDTCCFLPGHANCAMTGMKHFNTSGYTGVEKNEYGFSAAITMCSVGVSIGTFDSAEKASFMYKSIKEAYVRSLAQVYKDSISERAYSAMSVWSVE